MAESMKEIQSRITSQDIDVLRQSLDFVRQCHSHELERGKVAETRATVMLGILGVIATLVVPSAGDLTASTELSHQQWFLLVCFVACLLFLAKALVYAIRTISISKRYRLTPTMVYDQQNGSRIESLQAEISGVLWEYGKSVQYNSSKLFWLQRCQRNSFVAIMILVLFGLATIKALTQFVDLWMCISVVVGSLLGGLFVFLDPLAEKFGGIWNK